MKAIIIEDEIPASKHLQQVLEEVGDISVVSVLESVSETIEWFSQQPQPDIIFMDIHLADGNAFEIFKHVNIRCPVIFTTAFDEYALNAFKVNSIDYLLKPIEVSEVRTALKKLEVLSANEAVKNAINGMINTFSKESKYKTRFLIPVKGTKLLPVQTSDLACFYIDSGVVKASTFDGRTLIFDYTLDQVTRMLDPELFIRANRQYIIARAAIRDVDIWINSRLAVNLKISVPGKIIISKARMSEFKNWLGD